MSGSYASYWKGNSGKTQKPSKKDSPAAINSPGGPMDSPWTLMDADGMSPPTYPDPSPQPGPTRTSAQSSTSKGGTGYSIVLFRLYLSTRLNDTHTYCAGFGYPRSSHRVGLPFVTFLYLLASVTHVSCHFNRSPLFMELRRSVNPLNLTASWARQEVESLQYVLTSGRTCVPGRR